MSLILANCGGRPANPPPVELLALLKAGQPMLDCRDACLAEWRRIQPKTAQLDRSAQWNDLAVLVMQTRYQDDLSLYYLGRAAEGLGYYVPAGNYYRQSIWLSGTSISCQNLSRLCGDVALPASASLRLAAVQRMLAPPKQPRLRRTLRRPAARDEAGAPTGSDEPSATGGEVGAPASFLAPPAAPGGASAPAASEYIEPPPAPR